MKKRLLSLILCVCITLSAFSLTTFANPEDTVIILYENDVHCSVDGYSKLSAMKKELLESYEHVGVVSSGDYVQGGPLGSASRGEYIIELMNLVGYDAIALGNHEFDYRIERLDELVNLMNTKPVCCNFQKIGEEESYFSPYNIVSYGETDIAYIGITTPYTIDSAAPSQFKDENDNYIYTFNVTSIYEVVQKNIDKAKGEGADFIIALSHLGYGEPDTEIDVEDLIKNTEGFDVVLDAHSHSVIENLPLKDKSDNTVILTSTGTEFKNIGKLTISEGKIKTELVKTEEYAPRDKEIDEHIEKINAEYSKIGERLIGRSDIDLITHDSDGKRIVRQQNTNLGNLLSDAFCAITGAQIAFMNGGGIRSDIKKGDITYNDVLTTLPFGNKIVTVEVTGQVIKDMLEMALMNYPDESGAFPHMSNLTFSFNYSLPSSVKCDENGMFVSVEGEYRVYDIRVLNPQTGEYEPIDLDKTYTFAGQDFYVFEYGGGLSMFKDAKIIDKYGTLDIDIFEEYLCEYLDGVIGEEYASTDYRATFTDGFKTESDFVTRSEAIAALWELEGCPEADYEISFEDVPLLSPKADAIRWGASEGIVKGYSSTVFAPSDKLTREQLAVIIFRYAQSENVDTSCGESTNILSYEDAFIINEYAISAFQFICGSGIFDLNSSHALSPFDTVTQADFSMVIDNYLEFSTTQ